MSPLKPYSAVMVLVIVVELDHGRLLTRETVSDSLISRSEKSEGKVVQNV
jgi:hypothetical protein